MAKMFSKTCEYGMRAMLYIAKCSADGYMVGVEEIAAETNTPKHFVSKILQTLARENLVASAKGPKGGFYMLPKKVTMADIVIALEGKSFFTGCAMGLARCSEKNPCPMHHHFTIIRDELTRALEENTLSDIVKSLDNKNLKLK
jgi:Rrf2 family protein